MDNTGGASFMRNRRFESFLDTSCEQPNVKEPPRVSLKQEVGCRPKAETDQYVDDDGFISVLISYVRIVTCFVTMMVTTFVWAIVMLLLLPWPYQRIRQGNIYGHVTGRLLVS